MARTEYDLTPARAIARDLVDKGVDLNEMGKVLAYLRTAQQWDKALTLMERLASSGAVRSQQTRRYYQTIHAVCAKHLPANMNLHEARYLLGWAVRLARLPRLERLEQSQDSGQGRRSR